MRISRLKQIVVFVMLERFTQKIKGAEDNEYDGQAVFDDLVEGNAYVRNLFGISRSRTKLVPVKDNNQVFHDQGTH